ncbi:MAG: zinc-ribbon domain-containing protein [Candidatus Hodarchaeales archaeon]|jgi:hypothetical protein
MVYCEHCGAQHQDSDKFCSKCGFNLGDSVVVSAQDDLMSSPPKREIVYSPPVLTSQPRFINAHDSQPVARPNRVVSRPRRSSRSGWILGFAFLGIAFVFSAILLWSVIGINVGSCPFSDMGNNMGDFGNQMGDFGSRLGDFFGGLGDRLGDFFDGFGAKMDGFGDRMDGLGDRLDGIGDSIDSRINMSFPLTILSALSSIFFVGFIVVVIAFFVSRSRRQYNEESA